MLDSPSTRSELWRRRPGGTWHSLESGTREVLILRAKRMAQKSCHPSEYQVLRVGVQPHMDTEPLISYDPETDEVPVVHRVPEPVLPLSGFCIPTGRKKG